MNQDVNIALLEEINNEIRKLQQQRKYADESLKKEINLKLSRLKNTKRALNLVKKLQR